MKRNYIGLASTFHDGALAIVNSEGDVVFAEATERYLQNKRSINCAPDFYMRTSELLKRYCDPGAEVVAAHSWSGSTASDMAESLSKLRAEREAVKRLFGEIPGFAKSHFAAREYLFASQHLLAQQTGQTLKYELNQRDEGAFLEQLQERRYDHHLTHAAAACFGSPFEDAVCAVIDGIGEGSSTCCYAYRDGKLTKLTGIANDSPGSLGFFYALVCMTCGFGHLTGEEWKVMGLAPYGKPNRELKEAFRAILNVKGLSIEFGPDAAVLRSWSELHKKRRQPGVPVAEAADIARAGQEVFCDVYFEFLRNLRALGVSDNLVVTGGCALNSSANGRVLEQTGFRNLFIPSAPADDGNAVGAALLAYYEDHPSKVPTRDVQSAYLGSTLSDASIQLMTQFGGERCQRLAGPKLCQHVAQRLADGQIVGWVQGRAEFGPRALGNRSILADPRRADMKDMINSRVKFREEYRPLAPSILHEYGPEYFEDYQETPYMDRTLVYREDVRSKVPAVVHENGTGRLQTVKSEWNERYAELIRAFYELTGVPMLLNTSFNVMGKPIIHTLEDALAVFHTSGLDLLVVGDLLVEKRA